MPASIKPLYASPDGHRLSVFYCCILASFIVAQQVCAQRLPKAFKREANDSLYRKKKDSIMQKLHTISAGSFGFFVTGVKEDVKTSQRVLALTFDACGGPHGDGYDGALIEFLKANHIPATLFITGLWAKDHPALVMQLASDSLFEIENHGLLHRPCTIRGETEYGIHGTMGISEAIDEIELNAEYLQKLTGKKPTFFRSATAASDEGCSAITKALGVTIISYDVLSGDAVAGATTEVIRNNLVEKAHAGAIIIMHMNHPERNGFEALRAAWPLLAGKGYTFIKLKHHPLVGRE
jgi:peptidoglycan/xylan/chitin deacetylase (PgdA/CDA1 family)